MLPHVYILVNDTGLTKIFIYLYMDMFSVLLSRRYENTRESLLEQKKLCRGNDHVVSMVTFNVIITCPSVFGHMFDDNFIVLNY